MVVVVVGGRPPQCVVHWGAISVGVYYTHKWSCCLSPDVSLRVRPRSTLINNKLPAVLLQPLAVRAAVLDFRVFEQARLTVGSCVTEMAQRRGLRDTFLTPLFVMPPRLFPPMQFVGNVRRVSIQVTSVLLNSDARPTKFQVSVSAAFQLGVGQPRQAQVALSYMSKHGYST